MGDLYDYGTYVFGVKLCVLEGLYSSCIFKYDFIVYVVHSIISRGTCFNYLIRGSVHHVLTL
jgi:hypothetical protein